VPLLLKQLKKERHQSYLAAHIGTNTRLYNLQLAKGARGTWQVEQLVSRLLVKVGKGGGDKGLGEVAERYRARMTR
jgi:hypothetical protein